MKNILKYILSFAFCVGVIFATTTTTVNAEESTSDTVMCDSAFEVGDTYSFYIKKTSSDNWEYEYILDYEITNDDELYCCMYLTSDNKIYMLNAPMGIRNGYPPGSQTPQVSDYWFGNHEWIPFGYANCESYIVSSSGFSTNIPIFSSQVDAELYVNGDSDLIKSAVNYKKTYENGSWVKPFEDIEINDSNMSSPQLANVSHSGFTVVNIPDERYMVDVYLESGIQNPLPYEISLTSIGDALFVNSFGLVSDTEGAFTGEIDLLSCYGVDNISALNDSVSQFYSTYPSINAFNDSLPMETLKVNKPTWSIWGQPFGKSFVFFSKSSSANGTVSADNCPLAYTNYKVRYFYYDDDSGFHYGPWTNFIYFSDGRVMRGEVFQGNDGNIIESPLESGTQDSSGNVSMNYGSLVDIENPNELFGYLRSLINNINATGNNFMTLFGTVFSFLPSDLLAIIWLGIGCMILIGIIRAFN